MLLLCLLFFNMPEYAQISLSKQGSEYVLNMPVIVHSLSSLCKVLSAY